MQEVLNFDTNPYSDYSRLDILNANGVTTEYSSDRRMIFCTKGNMQYTLSVFQNTGLDNIERVFGKLLHREYWE